MQAGITRRSAAAKGTAPSVTKLRPMRIFMTPACRCCGVKQERNSSVATAVASGGTMPPSITEAMSGEATASPVTSTSEAVAKT